MSDKNRKKLTSEELYAFSDEMGMMISSGVSAIQGLTMMLDESAGGEEKELLTEMEHVVGETGSLSKAIDDSNVFPDYFVEMAKMGETTGKMDSVLTNLAAHYSREMAISNAIRSAVTYPLMMVAMMLIIIVVLVTEIMPVFDRVFKQLGGTMDGLSAGFLAVGTFMNPKEIPTFLYEGLKGEQIVHIFPYDSYTRYDRDKGSTDYVRVLMTPDELLDSSGVYNEMLVIEKGNKPSELDVHFPLLQKIALYCYDKIGRKEVKIAKENGV